MLESVQYRARGGQPAVSAELRIDDDREATLFVGTSWSVPPDLLDRAGRFAGQVTDDEWAGITRAVEDGDLTRAQVDQPATSPDPATRAVILTHDGGRETRLTVSGTQPPTAGLEDRLLSVMQRLVAQHPRAAVSAAVSFDAAGGSVVPRITLAHAGTEPLALLLYSDDPWYFLRVTFVFERPLDTAAGERIWLPVSDVTLARDDIARLVDEAGLPTGVHEMAPGAVYDLTAPAMAIPDSAEPLAVRTRIELWLPDGDTVRTTIELERQPLDPA